MLSDSEIKSFAATWPQRGRQPRLLARPGVARHGQFPLTEGSLSPVEEAILDALERSSLSGARQ